MLQSTCARLLALFPESCIESPMRRDRHGFARVSLSHQGKYITLPAHRLAYGLFIAPARPGQPVRHTCGNPACINPWHQFASEPAAVPPAPTFAVKGGNHDQGRRREYLALPYLADRARAIFAHNHPSALSDPSPAGRLPAHSRPWARLLSCLSVACCPRKPAPLLVVRRMVQRSPAWLSVYRMPLVVVY
ncbi:MAG: hypothetical protein IPP18_04885 [Rhodocyclaceae bacterium]|nr:hypothetical protein [Rhodocyclaceae bacterium]MBK6677779.1 hypothetical protein [Rhodocyclaceae bacterium]MBK9310451.1 hypothetical protein [Rhodocyclaceae bacterium]MBK9954477.1 hypothetical protein [Rhodocyclaceae bacterium]